MFERFTQDARTAVALAQDEARRAGSPQIEPSHLLAGMLASRRGLGFELLEHAGLRLDATRRQLAHRAPDDDVQLDAATLWTVGIDLDAVRQQAEDSFGPGALDAPRPTTRGRHIPFGKPAKKSLELALREALRLGAREISAGHLILGVLRTGEPRVGVVLSASGVDPAALRADVQARLGDQAA